MESNFYLKLSHYMNPRFNFNLSLLLDNYLEINKIKDESNKVISKHLAAYPEIIMTSSLKNNGIEILRTYLASFA